MLNKIVISLLYLISIFTSVSALALSISDTPLFLTTRASPNVLLNMSVESPMAGAAYSDQLGNPAGCGGRQVISGNEFGTCYFPNTTYLGYFNPNKCYDYDSGNSRFTPSVNASATHTCSSKWSGNLLNWATMTAIDEFAWTMTGGNRVIDTTVLTVIRRANELNQSWLFPNKILKNNINVSPSSVTPFSNDTIYISYNGAYSFKVGTSAGGNDKGTFTVQLEVCNPAHLESNCKAYSAGGNTYYKPEGLIQKNSSKIRFAVSGFSLDGEARDGGVLRSTMKYVGPTEPAINGPIVNLRKEFGADGIIINNPENAPQESNVFVNSGVINYINKFSDFGYKSSDPAGELYYEGLRYFKHIGRTPEYADGLTVWTKGQFQAITNWDDPIQYSCQKNFIIGINDANPWLDKKLPGTFFDCNKAGTSGLPASFRAGDCGQPSNPDPDINVAALTNRVGQLEGLNNSLWQSSGTWTSGSATGTNDSVGYVPGVAANAGSCVNKTIGALGEVMGTCPATQKENSYYIAGLAFYANTTDLRSDIADKQTVGTYMIDTQEYGVNPLDGNKNMLWLAGKYGGFNDKNNNGIPDLQDEWDGNHDGIPDNYVFASQPDKLVSALNSAFSDILAKTASAAALAANSTSLQSSTVVYQAQFDSKDWTGHLYNFTVAGDGAVHDLNSDGLLDGLDDNWDAATLIPAASSRNIFTIKNGVGKAFTSCTNSNLSAAQKGVLNSDINGITDNKCNDRMNWLRGDSSKEARFANGVYRNRIVTVLGDIINSDPAFSQDEDFGYSSLPTGSVGQSSYASYVVAKAGRTPTVFVGANDGMLHAFRADVGNANSGVELFAVIPNGVFSTLSALTSPNYTHKYTVDGSPTVGDAYVGGSWKTILLSGLRAGGKSIFALNISSPSTFSASDVMWEFSDAADLGLTYSQPQFARLHDGSWAAIFGNGYNSTSGKAFLYIVNVDTGVLIKKIPTNNVTANGLSTPYLYDSNGDKIVDSVYAGDLQGNMWKFDLSAANSSAWVVANAGQPLFTARNASNQVQPIAAQPAVGPNPNGGVLVYFGTGQYITDTDASNTDIQTFYAVWDNGLPVLTTDRSDLQAQTIVAETTQAFTDPNNVVTTQTLRETSANTVAYAGVGAKRGWYMDLQAPLAGGGERAVSKPLLKYDRVIFVTTIPSAGVCDPGGASWLMELDAVSGARTASSAFDFNNDDAFDSTDSLASGNAASGVRSSVGITQTPVWLDTNTNKAFKGMSGSSGGIMSVKNKGGSGGAGGVTPATPTRVYWQQIL